MRQGSHFPIYSFHCLFDRVPVPYGLLARKLFRLRIQPSCLISRFAFARELPHSTSGTFPLVASGLPGLFLLQRGFLETLIATLLFLTISLESCILEELTGNVIFYADDFRIISDNSSTWNKLLKQSTFRESDA